MSKISYLNWLVEERLPPLGNHLHQQSDRGRRVEAAVRAALKQLPEADQELIRLYYFQGRSLFEIAADSGRSEARLRSRLRQAVRRLRRLLGQFVYSEFGLETEPATDCPICSSEHRHAIDRLIEQRSNKDTWRPTLRQIRKQFGLRLNSVQTLIGHARNHRELEMTFDTIERSCNDKTESAW